MLTVNDVNKYMPKKEYVTYVQFEAWHLDNIKSFGFESLSDDEIMEEKESIIDQAANDLAFTVMYKNKPICVFGCLKYWNGVAEMWALISDDIRKFPVYLTRAGQKWASICNIVFNLHRLEMTVKASDDRATRWAYALGFKHESLMEKYSAKQENFNLFVRINYER